MSHLSVDPTRRRLLTASTGLFAAASLGAFSHPSWAQAKPLPQYVAWKNADNLIVHTSTTIETKRSALAVNLITPEQDLYIRNNLPPPNESIIADRDAWQVQFEGVKNSRTLTVKELKALGTTQLTMVLQCSGNGRGYFPHKPSGTPWQVGAAGNVTWTGVPLKTVIAALGGANSGVYFLTGTGGETIPAGVDPKTVMVERSVPLKALEDALLAWDINGHPISLAHGGPLRLIVPGYSGVNNVKYIKRVALTATESDARIMTSGYRMTPLNGKPDPTQESVWEMSVKSWINSPGPSENLRSGTVVIQGVAFGGMSAAKSVEVSIDGGKTWLEAPLVGADMGKYAWRQFVLPMRLQAGTYVLASRATDANGKVQPEERLENAAGYSNNSWRDHAFQITVA